MSGNRRPSVAPPRWSPEDLTADLEESTLAFRNTRLREPLEEYRQCFLRCQGAFDELLSRTADLAELTERGIEVLSDERLFEAVRYLAGPPISRDDLETILGSSLGRATLRANPELARRAIDTVLLSLDRQRFPWLAGNPSRAPADQERAAAVLASAGILATRQVETVRRSVGKDEQEERVKAALRGSGFCEVPARNAPSFDHAPRAGEFCGECLFGTRKADLLVRLWDGRLMPIECKVSNSSTNSIKRLNNDAAQKAVRWTEEFGTLPVVPSAVLGGVFKLMNLEAAQANGLTIFWAHDLESMLRWIESTRPAVG